MNNCIDFSESGILLNIDKNEVLITMELFKMLADWLHKFLWGTVILKTEDALRLTGK